jgi:hypothetical protein
MAGAIAAAGTRAGGDGLGWALAAVFALTAVVAVIGAAASGRLDLRPQTISGVREQQAAAVD